MKRKFITLVASLFLLMGVSSMCDHTSSQVRVYAEETSVIESDVRKFYYEEDGNTTFTLTLLDDEIVNVVAIKNGMTITLDGTYKITENIMDIYANGELLFSFEILEDGSIAPYERDKQEDETTIKEELQKAWDTFLVPLLSGVSITSVLSAVLSLVMAYINRKNNKKSQEEVLNSTKKVMDVVQLSTQIINCSNEIILAIKNQNEIAEQTKNDLINYSNDLLNKITDLTLKTEDLLKLKSILAALSSIATRIALNSKEMIQSGMSEDIIKLNDFIQNN